MTSRKTDHASLPDGTLALVRYGSTPDFESVVVVRGGTIYGPSDYKERHPHLWGNTHSDHYASLRTLVPAPEGMTRADAEAALADAGAWVEMEEGAIPRGTRARIEWTYGVGNRTYYVHRDDLPPADPDAELVEKMARKIESEMYNGFTDRARALLAIVREHEARS